MQLPIPIEEAGKRYVEADVQAPTAACLADTSRAIDNKNVYEGLTVFLGGSVRSFTDEAGDEVTEPSQVRKLCRMLPYRSAEWVAIQVVLQIDPDDGIEGVYSCPRCHEKQVAEKTGETEEEDNRDHVSDLQVSYMEPGEPLTFEVTAPEPFVIKDRKSGEAIYSIESMELRYPTLGICAAAYSKYGANDDIRRQLAFYVDSLVAINGQPIDQKFRGTWGMYTFENQRGGRNSVLAQISERVREYGLDQTIEKVCSNCGKVWRASVDTSNFFAYALRSL